MAKQNRNQNKLSRSRREFMKQMGVAAGVAAPFFSSKVAMGQTSTAPTRVLIVFLQHGWGFDYDRNITISANSNGTINSFPSPLTTLNAIKDQCVVVDALRTGYWGNAHDVSYSDILSCAVSPDTAASGSLGGPFMVPRSASLDWRIGNAVNKGVLRFSHHYTSWGANHHPMSFDNSLRNLPFYTNPRAAYMALIDPLTKDSDVDIDSIVNDALLKALGNNGLAFLDRVSDKLKPKMQSYISAVNALGNRILSPDFLTNVTFPPLPGLNAAFSQNLDSYLDIIKVCFQLDTHRVAVLGLGEGSNDWSWTDSNGQTQPATTFGTNFHGGVAHYGSGLGESFHAMHGWTRWYASRIAAFVNNLKNTIDVDGKPMIDNTVIVLTGEVGNGEHDQRNIPHVVIGGGGQGRIRRNRVITLPKFEPRDRKGFVWGSRLLNGDLDICGINYGSPVSQHHLADLWVSVARLAGLNIDTFGFDVYNNAPIQLT